MEGLNNGQLVQEFCIEAGDSKQWKPVAAANAIGLKRIEALPAVTTSRVRRNIPLLHRRSRNHANSTFLFEFVEMRTAAFVRVGG